MSDILDRAGDTVAEAQEASRALAALARQLRVLASNTTIEASRLPQAAALGEIAHRMRLLAEQTTELNTALQNSLQAQLLALEELRPARTSPVLGDDSTGYAESPVPYSATAWRPTEWKR
jgi:hypothetical protein